jgi:hypothetical protein
MASYFKTKQCAACLQYVENDTLDPTENSLNECIITSIGRTAPVQSLRR